MTRKTKPFFPQHFREKPRHQFSVFHFDFSITEMQSLDYNQSGKNPRASAWALKNEHKANAGNETWGSIKAKSCVPRAIVR